jgi:integrase
MRLGEVRDLHWEDLDRKAGIIHIRHNWQDLEGVKGPKCGSVRDVPLPATVYALAEACRKEAAEPRPLVFGRKDGKPLCNGWFRLALAAELVSAGVNGVLVKEDGREAVDDSEQKRRNITFHSLRHTFVSLAQAAGVNEFQAQALAGHKRPAMTERYSHRQGAATEREISECGKIIEGFFRTS